MRAVRSILAAILSAVAIGDISVSIGRDLVAIVDAHRRHDRLGTPRGVVRELYDVAFLPGVRHPSLIGFKTDEIHRLITIDEDNAAAI